MTAPAPSLTVGLDVDPLFLKADELGIRLECGCALGTPSAD